MIIHGGQGNAPEKQHFTRCYASQVGEPDLPDHAVTRDPAPLLADDTSLAPNALTERLLPYFLMDMERDAAVAYAALARDAHVVSAGAIPTYPAIIVCSSAFPAWIGDRCGFDMRRGLRDLLLQGLAWSLQPDPMDGLQPPYALYWSHVIPTAEILAALQAQSRGEGVGLR